jgi:hypothetical protein
VVGPVDQAVERRVGHQQCPRHPLDLGLVARPAGVDLGLAQAEFNHQAPIGVIVLDHIGVGGEEHDLAGDRGGDPVAVAERAHTRLGARTRFSPLPAPAAPASRAPGSRPRNERPRCHSPGRARAARRPAAAARWRRRHRSRCPSR